MTGRTRLFLALLAVAVAGSPACNLILSDFEVSPTACVVDDSACSAHADCCSNVDGHGYCVDGLCAESCSQGSECPSGCCALLGGVQTCQPSSACP